MATIRQYRPEDLLSIQTQNLLSLPENYTMKFYYYHYLTNPELSWVAVDSDGHIVGYVLAKIDEEDDTCGGITSVAVARSYRRLGLAHKLMKQSMMKMVEVYALKKCRLNVRESNYAAIHMYHDVIGFKQMDIDVKYYADGENGIKMEFDLSLLTEE